MTEPKARAAETGRESEVHVTACARRGAASRSLLPPVTAVAWTLRHDLRVHQ
jgi:hypothetical protein